AAFFIMIPLVLAGVWLYDALLTSSSWQGTVGKRVLRLKVTDLAGNKISFARATGRFFAKLISRAVLTMFIYLVVAFTERKQGLHDLIAGTLVMKY
ncbi:MAG TPA: RDD family protein, partial [Candidatus Angelobacter sp.]|nr:RDD family protein [Candidatus Angelobacter sp.]